MTDPVTVHIKNFQSIADLKFEVSGFTCITGKTNIGKSAIIRAISGALLNTPVVSLVRKGEKYATVELQSSDWGFKWEKAEKGVNRYWLPGKEKPLDKVGLGQTDFVQGMGFQSIQIGKDTVQPWYAGQFHPIFLIDRSGPAITDFISEISRLKVLQTGIIINVRNRKRALDEARVYENNVERLKAKDSQLNKLDDLLELESDLDGQLESIEDYSERIIAIEEFISQIDGLSNRIQHLAQIESVRIPTVMKPIKLEKMQKMISTWTRLEILAKKIIQMKPIDQVEIPTSDDCSDEIERITKGINIHNRLVDLQNMVDLLSVDIPSPSAEKTPEKLSRGQGILRRMEDLEDEGKALRAQENTIQVELDEVQAELDKIPLCPTCKMPSVRPLPCPDHQT